LTRFKQPYFDYLSRNPERAANFAFNGPDTAAILEACDFSQFDSLIDVGGGNGDTLCGILGRHAHLSGTLYDLLGVIERAGKTVEREGMSDRIRLVSIQCDAPTKGTSLRLFPRAAMPTCCAILFMIGTMTKLVAFYGTSARSSTKGPTSSSLTA
jgi:O-methyltransferase domain